MPTAFAKLPVEAGRKLGVNAGVLMTAFDVARGVARREDILGATVGPVRFSAAPRFNDFGRTLENCPDGVREMLRPGGWTVKLSGTLLTSDTASTRRLLALADVDGSAVHPRAGIDIAADFGTLWLVFDYGCVGGARPGHYAVCLRNAVSTGGLRLLLEGGRRARWPFEFTACAGVGEIDRPPFDVYVERGSLT